MHSEYYRWQTKVTTLEFLTIGMYATTFTIDRHFCRRSRSLLAMVTFCDVTKNDVLNFSRWILSWLRRPSKFQQMQQIFSLCPTLSMNSFYFIVYITNKYIEDVLYRYRETFWDFFCVFYLVHRIWLAVISCIVQIDFNQHIYPDYTANYFKYLHEIVFISDII